MQDSAGSYSTSHSRVHRFHFLVIRSRTFSSGWCGTQANPRRSRWRHTSPRPRSPRAVRTASRFPRLQLPARAKTASVFRPRNGGFHPISRAHARQHRTGTFPSRGCAARDGHRRRPYGRGSLRSTEINIPSQTASTPAYEWTEWAVYHPAAPYHGAMPPKNKIFSRTAGVSFRHAATN